MVKTILILLIMMCSTLTARPASVEPYGSSRIFWDTATRRTVFNGGWYARIIELHDGRLMAVCEGGGIKIAFSQDKGASWSSATKIVSNPAGINESVPDLIQLSDGSIIVAYNPRPTSPYSEDRKFGIRCKRSTDDLVTPVEGTLCKCISVSQSWESLLGRVTEGPFVWKNDSIYYLTYSVNDYRSQDYAVGYAMSRSLSTTGGTTPIWQKYVGNPIVHRVEGLVGTGHHSLFTDKEGRLRIVFHAHHSESVVAPRRMYIGTMEFQGNVPRMAADPIIHP